MCDSSEDGKTKLINVSPSLRRRALRSASPGTAATSNMLAFNKVSMQRVTSRPSFLKRQVLQTSRSVAMQAAQQQVSTLKVF